MAISNSKKKLIKKNSKPVKKNGELTKSAKKIKHVKPTKIYLDQLAIGSLPIDTNTLIGPPRTSVEKTPIKQTPKKSGGISSGKPVSKKQSSKKSSDRHTKSSKKSVCDVRTSKKTGKSVKKQTIPDIKPCDWIYLDNITSSVLCPRAEQSYKKNINTTPKTPSDKLKIMNESKKYLLDICGTTSEDYSVYFTSGEIESNRIMLCCAVHAYKKIRQVIPHVVISSVEHGSILTYAKSLYDSGQIELSIIKPNTYGCILSNSVFEAVKSNTCLVLITYINHELGSVNNIEKISSILHEKYIPLHSNCTCIFGKHTLDLGKVHIDSVTISFDKLNGPVGVGALIVNNKFFDGYKLDEHSTTLENKREYDIASISASIESTKFSLIGRKNKNKKILKFRNEIIDQLGEKCQTMTFANFMKSDAPPLEETSKSKNKLVILGPPTNNESYYTPSILSLVIISAKKKTGEVLQAELEKKGIVIGLPDLSKNNMYNEIGMPEEAQKYIIRISLPDDLTQQKITKFLTTLKGII